MNDIIFWHWWILGIGLLVLEVFAPGAFFLWMGIGAGLVGFLLLIFPSIAWEYQLMVFVVFSIVSIAVWKTYQRKHPPTSDKPTLNQRGEQYVGRTFTLREAIVDGLGKIKVDDTTWKVRGRDCAAGTHIKVTGVDGTILLVEKAE